MKLISPFIKIQEQLRIFHWQSETYAEHKAYGKAYEQFNKLVDDFVEAYIGKNGKVKARITYSIELDNYGEHNLTYLNDFISYLIGLDNELDLNKDFDLLNIRDEMILALNKLKYLLLLK
jgi:hypothetical protein